MTENPNVLMMTCHDIGQHLGCYGVATVQSPNIDCLAAQGMRFENFCSTSPVCSPARASLHTGRYPQSNGLLGLTHGPWWWSLNGDERHTAQILGEAGYDTYLIGFNHIDPENPQWLGYEHVLSHRKVAAETVQATCGLIGRATSLDRPFFAKVGFTEVHRSFRNGSDDSRGVFVPGYLADTPEMREDFAAFQATIRFFDQRVGEILEALRASPAAGNTLVILSSDHGIPYPGAKWTVRRAGLTVPLIIYQPGTVFEGGRTVPELMSNVDLLPTLLDFLDVGVPDRVQGVSFMDFLRGDASEPPRHEVFGQYTPDMKRDNPSRSIMTDRYQLIRYFDAGRAVDYPVAVHPQRFANHVERCSTKGTRPFAQLYDLREDPWQLNDLGSDEAYLETVTELSCRLLEWMTRVDDPLLEGPMRTPYYERAIADLRRTQ